MRKLRILALGSVLALSMVPAFPAPAQACWSTQCVVDCVTHIATEHEILCRL
jgi:hypothetical protein